MKKSALATILCYAAIAKAEAALAAQSEAKQLARKAVACVGLVLVRNARDQTLRPRGSAVVVRSDGIVVTNHHVIADQNRRDQLLYNEIFLELKTEGGSNSHRYQLRPLIINKEYDLALLLIEPPDEGPRERLVFPAIEIGDSQSIQLLEELIIIGYPEKGGSTVTISRGVVEGKDMIGNWIKTDARIIHGNSGGAAINTRGELIGIPTRVVADAQPIDKDGDGFPDEIKVFGAVGFLRPAHLIKAMMAQLGRAENSAPLVMQPSPSVLLMGSVRSAKTGAPIAGAMVGLLPKGMDKATQTNLLAWGSTNPEGHFKLNRPVPPGRYTLKARALGYEAFSMEVELSEKQMQVVVELRSLR
jgi:S1-C subfamily serine protease